MSRKITRDELLENLLELQSSLGRVPRKEDLRLNKGSRFGASAYKREFGSISGALLAANMKPHQIRGLDSKAVLEDIKDVFVSLGHTPQHEEYKLHSNIGYSFPKIRNMFGSWTKALIKAGIPVINAGKVDSDFVLEELRKWHTKNNGKQESLSYWFIRKAKARRDFPFSCSTIKNTFPNQPWEDIMKQIDPSYESNDPFMRRSNYVGEDGNIYKSKLELEVGNHLNQLKLSSQIIDYVYEARVCNDRLWTCDFLISNNNGEELWLEVDGLRNNRKTPYKLGNEKIKHYLAEGMKFHIISYNNRNISNFLLSIISGNYRIAGKNFDLTPKQDTYVFFTKKEVYDFHQTHGSDWVFANLALPFYEYWVLYVEKNGWPYPTQNEVAEQVVQKLHSKNGKLSSSDRIGCNFMKSHFRSFWDASFGRSPSPIDCVFDSKIMIPLLKYRFGISNSKPYKYKFDGEELWFNELFDINLKSIRKSLEVNRYVVSLFKPLLAKHIYQRFGFEGMRVWDPCGGFGGRMLGFAGTFQNGTYITNEPNPRTCSELVSLSEMLTNNIVVYPEPVEDAEPVEVDMVFTSPPYDFKEHYCDSPAQSDVRYSTHKEWVDGFLYSLVIKSFNSLRDDGRFVIVIDGKNAPFCEKIARKVGFDLNENTPIVNSRNHLNPSVNYERCLVFSKPSA